MDDIFEQEQEHLSKTYAKLVDIETQSAKALKERLGDAAGDRKSMMEELTWDFTGEVNVETYVEIESLHKIIDAYNLANDMDIEKLDKVHLLKKQPYFAKVSLQFKPGAPVRDVYIGTAGMTDDRGRHFIVDWRSPVAEVYYNQESGRTSYVANGRTVECDLVTRRQFDIERDKLNGCFDTTIAIEDPLLLQSLARQRSDKMADITTTIQKEQNVVVRHEDVPAMLVNGIAGSGKTSVLLQRIAYLLYQDRDNLDPRNVWLITPNKVFESYIANVLPDMGEGNPQTCTWQGFAERLGAGERGLGGDEAFETLSSLEDVVASLTLNEGDFADIRVEDEVVISAGQAKSAWNKYRKFPAGPHRAALAIEDLLERLESRIKRLTKDEDTQILVSELTPDEQLRYFGQHLAVIDDDDMEDYTRRYLVARYVGIEDRIESADWLRIERIGMRAFGKKSLSSPEYLGLKIALTGVVDADARYVMIDEVQDYTQAQLAVLARYFKNAHFLLLGDPNQAIREGTASWEQIAAVFGSLRGDVAHCELMTSYRSTPQITSLFTSLMDASDCLKTNSVQRDGDKPQVLAYQDRETWETVLKRAVREASSREELAAVVAADKRSLKELSKLLADEGVELMDGKRALPQSGVVLLDVTLAKGLEFDEVIVPDASAAIYQAGDVCRHRLYTAMSRATKRLTVLALGELTSLLA